MNEDPLHGVDGWKCLSYQWTHENNVGRFEYARRLDGVLEHHVVLRYQNGDPWRHTCNSEPIKEWPHGSR